MQWHKAIENTVTGLGYDLVDVERAAHGLLRVTIDLAPAAAGASGAVAEPTVPVPATAPAASEDAADEALPPAGITVEDCERVTRQLQLALEVEGLAYERLEVSSPGLDRPLRRESDFQRFAGAEVKLTLKLPFQGRKHWVGVLQRREGGWQLELTDGGAGAVRVPCPAMNAGVLGASTWALIFADVDSRRPRRFDRAPRRRGSTSPRASTSPWTR